MPKWTRWVASVSLLLGLVSPALSQQQSGAVGSGPPEDVTLAVTIGPDGALALSQGDIRLALGGYYRFGLTCPADLGNEAGISFTAPELIANAHLRLISVADPASGDEINFHAQGLSFRQIDCEGLALSARFSFHPMRRGSYPFRVFDGANPPHEATGRFTVE